MKKSIMCVVASIIVIVGAELRADEPKMDFAKIEEITAHALSPLLGTRKCSTTR